MRKIIMPMASAATVSVTQVEGLPTKGSARSAQGRQRGAARSQSSLGAGHARSAADGMQRSCRSLMRIQREAEQALLQGLVRDKLAHGAGMHDAPVVHDDHIVAERRGAHGNSAPPAGSSRPRPSEP